MVDRALQALLGDLVLPARWTAAALQVIDKLESRSRETMTETRNRLDRLLEQLEERSTRLRRHLVDEVISPEDYKRDKADLDDERLRLLAERQKLANPGEYLKPWADAIEWLNQGPYYIAEGTPDEKRDLAQRVTFNCVLQDRTVLIQAKTTFAVLRDWRRCPTVRRG